MYKIQYVKPSSEFQVFLKRYKNHEFYGNQWLFQ